MAELMVYVFRSELEAKKAQDNEGLTDDQEYNTHYIELHCYPVFKMAYVLNEAKKNPFVRRYSKTPDDPKFDWQIPQGEISSKKASDDASISLGAVFINHSRLPKAFLWFNSWQEEDLMVKGVLRDSLGETDRT